MALGRLCSRIDPWILAAAAVGILFRFLVFRLADGAAGVPAFTGRSELWAAGEIANAIRAFLGLPGQAGFPGPEVMLHPGAHGLLLGPVFALFGPSLPAATASQLVVDGALVPVAIHAIAFRLLGDRGAARVAAWAYALSPPMAVNAAFVVNSTPGAVLAILAVWAGLGARDAAPPQRRRWLLAAALATGAAMAIDNKWLLYPLPLAALVAWRLRPPPLRMAAAVGFVLAALAVMAAMKELSPRRPSPGLGAVSNLAAATAAGIAQTGPNRFFPQLDPPFIPDTEWLALAGHPYDESVEDRRLLLAEIERRLGEAVRSEPALFLKVAALNLVHAVLPRNTWTPAHLGPLAEPLRQAGLVTAAFQLQRLPTVLLALAYGAGAVLLLRRRRWDVLLVAGIPMLYLAAVLMPSFTHPRYVVAANLTFCVLAGHGAAAAWRAWRRRASGR